MFADLPYMFTDVHGFSQMFVGTFYGFSLDFRNVFGFRIFPLIFFDFRGLSLVFADFRCLAAMAGA